MDCTGGNEGDEFGLTAAGRAVAREYSSALLAARPDEETRYQGRTASENDVVGELESEGWSLLGFGVSRLVFLPPEQHRHRFVVVKLSRPFDNSYTLDFKGVFQNRTEKYVSRTTESGHSDGGVPHPTVYESGQARVSVDRYRLQKGDSIDDGWLVMEWVPRFLNLHVESRAELIQIGIDCEGMVSGPAGAEVSVDNLGVAIDRFEEIREMDNVEAAKTRVTPYDFGKAVSAIVTSKHSQKLDFPFCVSDIWPETSD